MAKQFNQIKLAMKKLIFTTRFFLLFSKMRKIKFNVGSGGFNNDNQWYATDIDSLNITKNGDWLKLLLTLRIDNIMAEHVWEHLTETQTALANRNCYKYLKKKGRLRIAVPDGFHPDKEYIEHVRPGGIGAGADDHQILYTYLSLKEKLETAGFQVQLLEYWDEFGEFHFVDWTDEGGHIVRSRRYDERNKSGILSYTSLIVDAIKLS